MFIEVLYSDLTKERVAIDQAHTMRQTGVLAIIISCVDNEKPRVTYDDVGYRRLAQKFGKDFYYLLTYTDGGDEWYGIDARDRSDFQKFYKHGNPWEVDIEKHPHYSCFMITFEGEQVTDKVWDESMIIFEKEVH
jgi:hypothetical protein